MAQLQYDTMTTIKDNTALRSVLRAIMKLREADTYQISTTAGLTIEDTINHLTTLQGLGLVKLVKSPIPEDLPEATQYYLSSNAYAHKKELEKISAW